MSKSQDSICTLYIKLASIDAIGDLLYQLDGTGDITAIDKGTLLGTATIIQDLAAECKEAVVELESICHTKDKEVISDDFKEVDGVWTYKGFPVSEIEKLDKEDVDFALQFQSMGKEARDFAISAVMVRDARARRIANGDDLKPEDYESLYMEGGDKLESCIRTFNEIKALGDMLVMSGNGTPEFLDNTLENVGNLIISRVEATMDEINTKPVVSEEVQS